MNYITNIRELRQLQCQGVSPDTKVTTTIEALDKMTSPAFETLRDRFAMAAMHWTTSHFDEMDSAVEAYAYADAMLKAREAR